MDDNLILRALMGAAGASVLAEIDLEKKRQEAEDLRKQLDAARAEIETLRQQLDAANAAETLQRTRIERLQAFVGGIDNLLEQDRFDRRDIAELLIVLRSNSSATLTSSPTPVAEPLDAEGGA